MTTCGATEIDAPSPSRREYPRISNRNHRCGLRPSLPRSRALHAERLFFGQPTFGGSEIHARRRAFSYDPWLRSWTMEGVQSRRAPFILAAGTLAAVAALAPAGCASGIRASTPSPALSLARSASPSASSSRPARSSRVRPASSLAEVHDPGRVTGTLTGPCQARDNGRLPDRRCTPGAIDPAVTQADIRSTICVSGYTQTVRPPESQTEAFKFGQAYPAYGLAAGTVSELDHLVPLELGGANDAANLWPEAGPVPNPKDPVEDALNRAVCDGRIRLARAQRAIAQDWETGESSLGLSVLAPAPAPTRSAQAISCRASVSSSSPADYTTVDINVETASGASVTTVAHYKTTDHHKTAVADGAGQATVAYYISGATPGYTVTVDVTASAGPRSASCSTSFTPVS
jgi:hypothetical protein